MFGEFQSNCNEEAIIKIIGKVTQEFLEFEDFQKQIELRRLLDEVLYNYEVTTKVTSLVASDIEDKMRIYFASKKLEGMSNKTIRNYTYILERFAAFMKKPLSSITTMDIRMFLAYIGKNMKPGSVNAMLYCLKSFFTWLTNEEYILKNPTGKLKSTKVPKRLRHALSEEELELLKQACVTDREKCLLEFLSSSGCRLGEVIGIDKHQIDWYEMSLNVIGKGNKERKVYFSTKAKILMQRYLETRKDECEALFITERRPYHRLAGRGIEVIIDKIAKRAGFDKSVFPHLFRHSFATIKINSGMPLPILQRIMGHESPETTLIYANIDDETIKHEYKRTT